MSKATLSRRDFLKLGSYSLMGIILPEFSFDIPRQNEFKNLQARIINRTVWSFEEPNANSKRVKLYWHDLVVPIMNTTVSEDEEAYNRVWYELEEGGYAYSGGIQPVRTILNQPGQIPTRGTLGEVSVPYTDAYLEPNPNAEFAYRLYYETVHWVTSTADSTDGSVWYRLLDDKFERYYYVPAKDIRLMPAQELAPLSPEIPLQEKRIEVRLDEQLLLASEKGQ